MAFTLGLFIGSVVGVLVVSLLNIQRNSKQSIGD